MTIPDDATIVTRILRAGPDPHPFADRALPFVERLRKRFVDHHHWSRRGRRIRRRKVAALHHRNPHRAQILLRHRLVIVHVLERTFGRGRVTLEVRVVRVDEAHGRKTRHSGRRLHPRDLPQLRGQPREEIDAHWGSLIPMAEATRPNVASGCD